MATQQRRVRRQRKLIARGRSADKLAKERESISSQLAESRSLVSALRDDVSSHRSRADRAESQVTDLSRSLDEMRTLAKLESLKSERIDSELSRASDRIRELEAENYRLRKIASEPMKLRRRLAKKSQDLELAQTRICQLEKAVYR